jgi:hypothetical protein
MWQIVRAAALVAIGAAMGAVWSQSVDHHTVPERALLEAAVLGQLVGRVQQQTARFSEQCPVAWQLCDQAGGCWCPRPD